MLITNMIISGNLNGALMPQNLAELPLTKGRFGKPDEVSF